MPVCGLYLATAIEGLRAVSVVLDALGAADGTPPEGWAVFGDAAAGAGGAGSGISMGARGPSGGGLVELAGTPAGGAFEGSPGGPDRGHRVASGSGPRGGGARVGALCGANRPSEGGGGNAGGGGMGGVPGWGPKILSPNVTRSSGGVPWASNCGLRGSGPEKCSRIASGSNGLSLLQISTVGARLPGCSMQG